MKLKRVNPFIINLSNSRKLCQEEDKTESWESKLQIDLISLNEKDRWDQIKYLATLGSGHEHPTPQNLGLINDQFQILSEQSNRGLGDKWHEWYLGKCEVRTVWEVQWV